MQKTSKKNGIIFTNKRNRGSSVLELLFYIAFFATLSLLVIDAMITMAKSFKETSVQMELMQGGNIIEKISREIRQADSINSISASDLKLNTKDDSGADKTEEFLLSSPNIQFLENNILTGNLNTPNITVTSLVFSQINTTQSKAVKISLTIKSNNDKLSRAVDFYDTVVLRGSY